MKKNMKESNEQNGKNIIITNFNPPIGTRKRSIGDLCKFSV